MKQQDAIALLKADHKKVKGLFAEAEDLSDRATSQLKRLGDQICMELTVHTECEESVFYPAVKEATKRGHKDERDMVLEAYEEHALAKTLIADLQQMEPSDETYRPKLKTLQEMIDHHVKEEEREFFPATRELFDEEEMIALGQRMAEIKAQRMGAEPQEAEA